MKFTNYLTHLWDKTLRSCRPSPPPPEDVVQTLLRLSEADKIDWKTTDTEFSCTNQGHHYLSRGDASPENKTYMVMIHGLRVEVLYPYSSLEVTVNTYPISLSHGTYLRLGMSAQRYVEKKQGIVHEYETRDILRKALETLEAL